MIPGGWLQNPFIPMAWFFGVIFTTVLTAKVIGFAWTKWDQYRRSKEAVLQDEPDVDTVNSEIQQLRKALRKCKKDHAESALRKFAERVAGNIERRRAQDQSVKDIRVTVRFAEYKDVDLVNQIKTIIENCTQWPVVIDGSNKPTIMPDKDFKVVFDIGPWQTFEEVAWAFSYGELVKGKIASTATQRFDEDEHLIVNVLPIIIG